MREQEWNISMDELTCWSWPYKKEKTCKLGAALRPLGQLQLDFFGLYENRISFLTATTLWHETRLCGLFSWELHQRLWQRKMWRVTLFKQISKWKTFFLVRLVRRNLVCLIDDLRWAAILLVSVSPKFTQELKIFLFLFSSFFHHKAWSMKIGLVPSPFHANNHAFLGPDNQAVTSHSRTIMNIRN